MSRSAFGYPSDLGPQGSCARMTALAGALVALLTMCFAAQPAMAQSPVPAHRSYITPFPNGDRYRIVVLGDSMGEGL